MAEAQSWDVDTLDGFTTYYDATFNDVYRYLGRLCGAQRSLAEDLTQETFLSLLRAARSGASPDVDDRLCDHHCSAQIP